MARKKKITDQQLRFVDEYFIDYNQTAAAIRAGYSPRSASSTACDLMKNPDIEELIEFRKAQLSSRLGVSVQRIRDRLASMAFGSIANVVDVTEDGQIKLKKIEDISEIDMSAVQELTMTKGKNGSTLKVKMYDAKGAAELLGKEQGMFRDKLDVNITGGLADRMEAARRRVKQDE